MPADETEETARLKAADVAAIAWTELAKTQPATGGGAIGFINCYLEIWSENPSKVDYREVSGLAIRASASAAEPYAIKPVVTKTKML